MEFKHVKDTINLQRNEIPVKIGMVQQSKLRFYTENPRIYSIVNVGVDEPDQELIEKKLLSLEHVKELIQDIKANGGLIDPVIVLEESWEVIEGNSRLAAYRHLFNKSPKEWSHIKCTVLPKSVTESQIFTLLGQYHIKGKKDWAPFEQAGFLFRRHINHGIDVAKLASEIGLSPSIAKRYISTYQFMLDQKDNNVSRWSYYEEFIRSSKIKKLREKYTNFDDVIVSKIRSGEIKRAQDIRDKLPSLSNASHKLVKKFLDGKLDFEESMEAVEDSGNSDSLYLKLNKFRHWLVNESTESAIKQAKPAVKNKIKYEISKMTDQLKVLEKLIKSQHKT